MATVVNEFGETSGLITLEDILEQIFGSIEDEYDEEELNIQFISELEYLVSGKIRIDAINEGIPEISIPKGHYSSLSGYLTEVHGNIPLEGETLSLNHWNFLIEKASEKKIELVRITPIIQDETN
jgi:putative hemolysin